MKATSSRRPAVRMKTSASSSFLATPVKSLRDDLGGDERVEVVAVVEDEHRWSLLPRVLSPDDVDGHAVDGEEGVEPSLAREVQRIALVAFRQPDADRHGADGKDGRGSGCRPEPRADAAGATAGEPQHGPASLLTRPWPRFFAGVGRARVAYEIHERQLLVAVGVEVASAEVDPPVRGEFLDRVGLAGTPQHRLLHLARDESVMGRQPVAQHVVDAEVLRHGLCLVTRRRRAEHDGVAASLVRLYEIAHLRIDAVTDLLLEQAKTHLLEILVGPTPPRFGA